MDGLPYIPLFTERMPKTKSIRSATFFFENRIQLWQVLLKTLEFWMVLLWVGTILVGNILAGTHLSRY